MTVCSECGNQVDPDVTHTQHRCCDLCNGSGVVAECWDDPCPNGCAGCDCPEVCADCCRVPDCPLRDNQETPT